MNVAKENLGGYEGPGFVSIPALISRILLIEEKRCIQNFFLKVCKYESSHTRNGLARATEPKMERENGVWGYGYYKYYI